MTTSVYPNYYQNHAIHPSNRFYTSSSSAYVKQNGPKSNLKNVRRVEPTQILQDYRSGNPYGYRPNINAAAPIYATKPKNASYDGKTAYEAIKARIQETQRKRGNLIEGKRPAFSKKPRDYPAPTRPKPKINLELPVQTAKIVAPVVAAAVEKKSQPAKTASIDLAVKSAAPPTVRAKQTKPQPNANNDWSTNYNSDFVNWTAFRNDLKNPKPTQPTVSSLDIRPSMSQTNQNKNERRKLLERMKKERVVEQPKQPQPQQPQPKSSSAENNKENQENKQSTNNSSEPKFSSETTNSSTFKRWPTSAFQTMRSRQNERPVWANPNNSGHFVKHKRKKVLKDSTKDNMNITLSISGKSMTNTTSLSSQGTQAAAAAHKKSVFQTEYQRTYKKF